MRERLKQIAHLGGFLAFVGFLALLVSIWVAADTINLTDFTSGMTQTTVLTTLNNNNAIIESGVNRVGSTQIKDLSVTTAKIANLAVTGAKLAADSVDSSKVAADSLTAADLATGSVGTAEVIDGSLTTADISAASLDALLAAAGTRLKRLADAGQQSGISYSGAALRDRYAAATIAGTPKALVHCGGYIYAVVDSTAGTDYVRKITAATMVEYASINLASGDNPVDAVCGPDGSVYILTSGGVSNVKIKKITPAGSVSELATLGATADQGVALAADPNATVLWVTGSDSEVGPRTLYRIANPAGTVTSITEAGGVDADNFYWDLLFFDREGSDHIGVLRGDSGGASNECYLEIYTTAAPPVLESATPIDDTDGPTSTRHCSSMEFDGTMLIVPYDNAGLMLFDMSALGRVTAAGTVDIAWPGGTEMSIGNNFFFFSGRRFYMAQPDQMINIITPPMYRQLYTDYDFAVPTVTTAFGFATDGVAVYIGYRLNTTDMYVVKILD